MDHLFIENDYESNDILLLVKLNLKIKDRCFILKHPCIKIEYNIVSILLVLLFIS